MLFYVCVNARARFMRASPIILPPCHHCWTLPVHKTALKWSEHDRSSSHLIGEITKQIRLFCACEGWLCMRPSPILRPVHVLDRALAHLARVVPTHTHARTSPRTSVIYFLLSLPLCRPHQHHQALLSFSSDKLLVRDKSQQVCFHYLVYLLLSACCHTSVSTLVYKTF